MIDRITLLNSVFNEIERSDTIEMQEGKLVSVVRFGKNMQWRINNQDNTTVWFFKNYPLTLSLGTSEVEQVKLLLAKKTKEKNRND